MALPIHVTTGLERYPTAKRDVFFAKTANFTPTIRQTGAVFTNLGATGAVTFSLPTNSSGEKGIRYTFVVAAAQTVNVNPGAAGGIYWGGSKLADDTDLSSATIGHTVTVESDGNGDWVVVSAVGNWGQTLAIDTADKLTVGGVIVPQEIEVSFHAQAAADCVDQTFFVATQAYQVTKVSFVHATAETTAATLAVQVTKDTGTNAPGAGTDLLTDNTNTGFNAKSTANTVQTGTLTATAASLQLAAGNRLAVDFSASATELAGVTITVTLKRI